MSRRLFHLTVFLAINVLGVLCTNAQLTWRGIIPLVTTKENVEKKIGKPNEKGYYEFKEGRVSVEYVLNKCSEVTRCDCLVPLETVSYVRIATNYNLSVKKLKLNTEKYKKTKDSEHPENITYSNTQTGISYDTFQGKVFYITYYPSETICKEIEKKSKS